MLAGECDSTNLIFNGIKDNAHIEQVIIEKPVSKIYLLKRRTKTLGLMKVTGQIVFMGYNLWLKKLSQNYIAEIKRKNGLNDKAIDPKLITTITSINDPKTITLLKNYQPDIVIVNGTRIIKKEIINAIDAPFINIHTGITPKYRGTHGGYWALTEKDHNNCGVTVHLIDSGIDTGDVLYQKVINISGTDNINTYPYLQMAAAIPLMIKAIDDINNKSVKAHKINLPSKLWSHPTIFEYLYFRIRHKVK